jgi:ribonuclease HII
MRRMMVLCGIDEAGRGPIAGPVCAAAVVLPKDFPFEVLADSKKLSARQRERAEVLIKERSVAWGIAWSSHVRIDRVNILQATMEAMERAYRRVERKLGHVDLVLVDGNKVPELPVPCQAIVKGDDSVFEIMAASILAKQARDRLMILLGQRYPGYGYEVHKGYPTGSHRAVCRSRGPSPIQRMTFRW